MNANGDRNHHPGGCDFSGFGFVVVKQRRHGARAAWRHLLQFADERQFFV
jgi:hypothetical protein